MRELIRRRLHGDEDGVTLVIVALCLIALFGMLVLVVDVGGLLLNRRELVNASDAAALSAAKSCVLPPSKDSRTAEQAADEFASTNSSRAQTAGINITQISGCDTAATGYVSVQYAANQHLAFAPILGGGTDKQVRTAATAIWGPAGAANPLPIVIYQQSFNTCKLNTQIDPTKTCYVWEDNNNVNGPQSSFGLMDLRTDNPSQYGWDSVAGAGCTSPGNGPKDWITNYPDPSIGDLPINYPAPTYVCRANGNINSAWSALDHLIDDDDVADQNDDEDVLFFPINRCDNVLPGAPGGQLASNSSSEIACPQTPGQYDVIGYAAMKLEAIYDPNAANGTSGLCASDVTIAQGAINLIPFDITTLTANNGTSCPTSPPDQITSGPTVVKAKSNGPGPDPVGCPTVPASGCDYAYSNGFVTWDRSGPATEGQDFEISFGWLLAGPCGIPPPNNSGHCLVLLPVDVKIGGFNPGGGTTDSNVRAYKLCEPAISGSCDPISVPIPPLSNSRSAPAQRLTKCIGYREGERKMKSRGLVVAIAVVLAVLAAVGVIVYTSSVRDSAVTENTTEVLVSTQDIQANTPLDPLIAQGIFKTIPVPNEGVVADAVKSTTELEGQTATAPIYQNEQIPQARISSGGGSNIFGIDPGNIGLGLEVQGQAAVNGFVQQGDYVTIYATFQQGTLVVPKNFKFLPAQLQQAIAGAGTSAANAFVVPKDFTIPLVPAVEVLAVQNPPVDTSTGRSSQGASSYILNMTPDDAQELVFAIGHSTLYLGLLPPENVKGYPQPGTIGVPAAKVLGISP